MTDLITCLYQFAMKHRVKPLLTHAEKEITENEAMCAQALEQLHFSPDEADSFSRYRYGQDVLNAVHSEAAFRSGLSLGLELALLCQLPE